MPLYEYKCRQCGEIFEVLQKFSDPKLKVHAACGGVVERLLSSPAFQFKGTGWYVTDYARHGSDHGKNGGSSKSENGGSSKSDSAPSKPAETAKPAGSADSAPAKKT
jgi:putative FmdB family regulatory protein